MHKGTFPTPYILRIFYIDTSYTLFTPGTSYHKMCGCTPLKLPVGGLLLHLSISSISPTQEFGNTTHTPGK